MLLKVAFQSVIALSFLVLLPSITAAQAQSPGCRLPAFLPDNIGVKQHWNYSVRIVNGPGDPNGHNSWWSQGSTGRADALNWALEQWTAANAVTAIGTGFSWVPGATSGQITVRVYTR